LQSRIFFVVLKTHEATLTIVGLDPDCANFRRVVKNMDQYFNKDLIVMPFSEIFDNSLF
jgi:hypothetical protein